LNISKETCCEYRCFQIWKFSSFRNTFFIFFTISPFTI